jgi:hypothetical protein
MKVWKPPVVGGRWVGFHGPAGGSLSLRQSSGVLEHRLGMLEGCGSAEIVCACGSLAWHS